MAALIAVVVVYGIQLLRSAFNTRLRDSEGIAAVTGAPVLAEFPVSGRRNDPRLREAANYARAGVLFNSGFPQRVIMITSPVQGEGKSVISASLAENFARYGYRTLLIDADLRSPSIVERFEIVGTIAQDNTTAAWLDAPDLDRRFSSVSLGEGNRLHVLPQTQPVANASEVLGRRFGAVLDALQDFDVVVIDTPPVLAVADALMIAPYCTGIVMVVDLKKGNRRDMVAASNALRSTGVPLVGTVLNRSRQGSSGGARMVVRTTSVRPVPKWHVRSSRLPAGSTMTRPCVRPDRVHDGLQPVIPVDGSD